LTNGKTYATMFIYSKGAKIPTSGKVMVRMALSGGGRGGWAKGSALVGAN